MIARIIRISDRGFAFAAPDDGGDELFVHATALPDGEFETLEVGTSLEILDEMVTPRGLRAVRAQVLP